MDVRKTVAELTSQLSEVNYDSEEDNILTKGNTLDDFAQEHDEIEVNASYLRKRNHEITLPEEVYGGKNTTRKKMSTFKEFSDDDENEEDTINDSDEFGMSEEDSKSGEESEDSDEPHESEEEMQSESGGSEEPSPEKKPVTTKDSCNIYSRIRKGTSNDVKKGNAIRNQLKIWDLLLECRIKLQKALTASNDLPPKTDLVKAKSQLESEEKLKFNKCKVNLLSLLDKMVNLENDLLKQCDEFKKNKVRNNSNNQQIEEIRSDESEIEDDYTNDDEDNDDEDKPPIKKRKLNDYSKLIKDRHEKFTVVRNAAIQKWNDRTKVSSGKMANSDFSAFDQSTLKQIEQIMVDKTKLINKTRIKRNNQNTNSKEKGVENDALDPEVFDDTDFYHKLLRDYIERKAVDVTNSSQTERQMIQLQKLRSKMKKKVDTRATKGRKLRYVVLSKLVNFMAPNPINTWSEEAETELYNSLFGKIQLL